MVCGEVHAAHGPSGPVAEQSNTAAASSESNSKVGVGSLVPDGGVVVSVTVGATRSGASGR